MTHLLGHHYAIKHFSDVLRLLYSLTKVRHMIYVLSMMTGLRKLAPLRLNK